MPINWILNKIAGDYNEKQLKKIWPIVDEINKIYEERHSLSDDQIKAKTEEFKARLQNGETTDDLLVEAFATVKQACKRMMGVEIEVKGTKETWNMIPYDVQLIGGIVLHQGKNAEMRTGEGKTLVSTLPAYLNALEGKGVHVVTVNDYLASRDAQWMGYLHEWLGISVGSVTKGLSLETRKEEYAKDITYVENSELGFDYLRDNLAKSIEERKLLWRPLHYAIIDEVDSILIDEARTPLIISQASDEPTEKYEYYAKLVQLLVPSKSKKKVSKGFLAELLKDVKKGEDEEEDDGGHYFIDEKSKAVTLSNHGIQKLEELLGVENIYKDLGYEEIHHIENALRAQAVYNKDKEYLINDGQVMIVDENTGRVMPGRRYSEGLHQAIEAKENVQVQRESKTIASITYQHFFKLYAKLSGMTGTAATESEEFEKIYDLEVITIPTNKPILRVDKNDMVYFNQDAKWKAVVDHIKFYHGVGLPILIGASSIHTSELVSNILKKIALHHSVLNAKFHEQEANIVMNAGKKGSIVVATNMAGRGTDIKLEKGLNVTVAENYAKIMHKTVSGGDGFNAVVYSSVEYDLMIDALAKALSMSNDTIDQALLGRVSHGDARIKIVMNSSKKQAEQAYAEIYLEPKDGVKEDHTSIERDLHFGLFILGTEKHDSRRIDNQLRGRAGRQGDPGISQFFVAMDDEIMRKMGASKIQGIARMMLSKEDLESMAFTQSQFTSSIERSQKQMEGWHYGIRKHLFDYDSVINKQRSRVYAKRDSILGIESSEDTNPVNKKPTKKSSKKDDSSSEETVISLSIVDEIKYFIDETVEGLIEVYASSSPWNIDELIETLQEITGISFVPSEYSKLSSSSRLADRLKQELHDSFDAITNDIDQERMEEYCKRVYLHIIDKNWMQHITDMQYLREKVGLYGYAQLDPLVIYKRESYTKFQTLLATIRKETLGQVMRTDFSGIKLQNISQQVFAQPKTINMVEILKSVTQGLQKTTPTNVSSSKDQLAQKHETVRLPSGENAEVISDDDGIEVLELQDDNSGETVYENVDLSDVKKKLRPNDKVSIQFSDGRIEHNAKRKKVKDAVDRGEAKVLS